MKKLITILGALAMLATASHAQSTNHANPNLYYLLSGVQTVPAGASNLNHSIAFWNSANVNMQFSANLTGAGTAVARIIIDESNDGVTWNSAVRTFNWTAAGATPVHLTTNLAINAAPYLKFSIHNTNSVPITNISWSLATKRGI